MAMSANANADEDIMCSDDKITITKDMFITLLKDNREMMKMLKSMSEQHPNVSNTTNNNKTIKKEYILLYIIIFNFIGTIDDRCVNRRI
jgi:hypothetical protein